MAWHSQIPGSRSTRVQMRAATRPVVSSVAVAGGNDVYQQAWGSSSGAPVPITATPATSVTPPAGDYVLLGFDLTQAWANYKFWIIGAVVLLVFASGKHKSFGF